ncbi:MAG: DUF1553 domain-containing protein [Verrucomicrobia bacterium]|nr:DUF1553 domain-containing protein [Verrucomicrobiota bacterium]
MALLNSILRTGFRFAASFVILSVTSFSAAAGAIDFNRDIRPILSDHCFACHGPDNDKRKAGLRFDQQESAKATLKSGAQAVVPGSVEKSSLITRILSHDPDTIMPPPKDGKPLTPVQIDLLVKWVKEGASWRNHWSFLPPVASTPPAVTNASWPINEVDRFILERIERAGLAPASDAGKPAWLRRITFDLTGLPPTPEEVDAFDSDSTPGAHQRSIDRLLASPHYGERMAMNWLDLARYADTSGYHFDGVRFMWIWRDWVIKAFNENKRFDVFTLEQLAGDLLPNPTHDQRIATGFVRNNMTNDEGGADPDEYLNKYVADRVNTLGNVWLGMTVACAECHDHKFDPLKTSEYYQLYAFFHNVPEKGLDRIRTDNPPPRLPAPTLDQAMRFVEADFTLRDAEKTLQDRSNELGETQEKWEREMLASPPKPLEPAGLVARVKLDGSFAVSTPEHTPGETPSTKPPQPADPVESGDSARFVRDDQPEFVAARLGKGLRFDGKMHVDVGGRGSFGTTNTFSYGAWIKIEGSGAVFSKMESGPGYRGFDLFINDNRLEVHLSHKLPEDALKVRSREKIEGGGWRHVLVTYDGSAKAAGLKLYVDGRERPSEVERDTLKGSIGNSEPLRLGSRKSESHFKGQLDDVRFYDRVLSSRDARLLALEGMFQIVQKSRANRSDEERSDLQRFYRENDATDYLRSLAAVDKARKTKSDLIAAIPTSMIMEEMDPPRETHRLVRGDFRMRGERVWPGTPEFLPPLRKASVTNEAGRVRISHRSNTSEAGPKANRLDLAAWLLSPDHPLTARVTVNRYWAMFFGAGLVNTINDFGAQGEWPSHPELLDWLAARFRDGDPTAHPPVEPWDVKALVRLITSSRTYRQSALALPTKAEVDPYNRLLSRSPRTRLDAEFVRDNALAVSGLLNPRIGGASVKPYQPPGLWDGTDSVFVQDHGEDLFRRGLYVFWRRSAHYPAFATFDAPNREVCTFVRQRTQTPLQSLVLMNDPAFVECARGLAQRVIREEPQDIHRRLLRVFRLTLGRVPESSELDTLRRAYDQQLTRFQGEPAAVEALLKVGESRVPEGMDRVTLASMTAVANVLLNLNETITK